MNTFKKNSLYLAVAGASALAAGTVNLGGGTLRTAQQAATLAGVQFTVADLGGAYLGLAAAATNTVRIDDDAAMMGWSVVGDRSSVVGDR